MKRCGCMEYMRVAAVSVLFFQASLCGAKAASSVESPNVVLITADDLNFDSVGVYGCEIPGITPHIDRLAREGMRFTHAHVNIAVCQPSRQSIMTGRYPHRNGAEGFEPISEDVPTLQESLRAAGYVNGILGKDIHLKPKHKFCWDHYITESDLASGAGIGRSPDKYYRYSKSFFELAKDRKKPFFLMANAHDPHRPFAGSDQEKRAWGHDLPTSTRQFRGDEVSIPDCLPDLPDIRKEVAEYYTSVYRCDQVVGAVIKALADCGLESNTMVTFISDNGVSLPFAKANCYLQSTKTPWIVKWPGRVKPGSVDSEHLISGIDYMPTVLDVLGIEAVDGMDGVSFLPLLGGEKQKGREYAFTEFHQTFARRRFPMRCAHSRRFGYLINFWAGRTPPMRMDSTSGRTFKAMQEAGKTDPAIASRVALFEHRVLEEFYDFENDPGGLNNLVNEPDYRDEVEKARAALKSHMARTSDPALATFAARSDPAAIDAFMTQQRERAAGKQKR